MYRAVYQTDSVNFTDWKAAQIRDKLLPEPRFEAGPGKGRKRVGLQNPRIRRT